MSKKFIRKKELKKKVLYPLLTMSVMSICISSGNIWASEVKMLWEQSMNLLLLEQVQ